MSDKYPGGFVTTGAPAGFSVAFGGASTSYLSTGTAAGLDSISGDFTIEYWQYPSTGISGIAPVIGSANGSFSGTASFFAYETSTNKLHMYLNATQSSSLIAYASPTSLLDKWSHIAWVRSGSTITLYLNGTSVATVSYATSISLNTTNSNTYIGKNGWDAYYWLGYISNIRIVKGTALYTANFAPPTQLFPVTNTQLLICQSPTIRDNSTNNYSITANGSAAPNNFTPFAGYTGFNPALGAAAGGVWTIDEAAYYQNNRLWPIYDPYFNNTTLMLHGNGTNAAQNNTFLDSSVNGFPITRNGNTTQGSFSPFSQTGWSLYLPGSGTNYVQTPSSSVTTILGGSVTSLASLSFTVECFVNVPTGAFIIGDCNPGNDTANLILGINNDGTLSLGGTFGGYTTRNSTGAIQFNAWNHVAWVVTGAYVYFYINGAPAGSGTVGNTSSQYGQFIFGGYNNNFSTKQNLSNFRITKSVVYSGPFTPPTGPLTASTNTTLLTFQGNNYRDFSANNYALTVVGAPTIQAFSPFVPTVTTPTTYSNYFSGSGSYLTGVSNAALVFGTGTYTIEMWVYQNARSGTQYVLGGGGGFQLAINSSGYIFGGVAGVGDFTAATIAASLYTWTHIAIVRNSTSSGGVAYYVNGAAAGTATDATNYTSNVTLNIGTTNSNVGVTPFSGFLSNLRVLKGTALYTASFTPPTVPLTAITNTSLLTCQSTTIVDNSTNALTLTATGTVYPVTSPTPFPAKVDTTTLNSAYSTSLIGGSAYFDGSGDYLSLSNNAALFAGTGDFTMEFWIYPTSLSGNNMVWGQNANGLDIYRLNSTGKLVVDQANVGTILSSTANVIANTWTHYAVTRSGTTMRLFVNGALDATATNSANFTNANNPAIGASPGGSGNLYIGYIAGLRFVKGTALYTSSFAPPASPPTAVANTQLLTNFTNAGIFDNTAKNVFETVGGAAISTGQSKYGGSSMYFDGSGDWLSAPSTQNCVWGTGDFTIEFWVYPTTLNASTDYNILDFRDSNDTNSFRVGINGTTIPFLANSVGGVLNGSYTFTTNNWYHFAVTRRSGTLTIWINGTSAGTNTTTTNYTGSKITIGAAVNNTGPYFGYLDDIRVTKGFSRYNTPFTPPTSQLQDQ